MQLGAYKLPNKLSLVYGWGWVLDQVKIRLTQPQVELELGIGLGNVIFCRTLPSKS